MNNKQKQELRSIVKSIPEHEINNVKKWLHEKYASDFTYQTFVNYLKVFRPESASKSEEVNK